MKYPAYGKPVLAASELDIIPGLVQSSPDITRHRGVTSRGPGRRWGQGFRSRRGGSGPPLLAENIVKNVSFRTAQQLLTMFYNIAAVFKTISVPLSDSADPT